MFCQPFRYFFFIPLYSIFVFHLVYFLLSSCLLPFYHLFASYHRLPFVLTHLGMFSLFIHLLTFLLSSLCPSSSYNFCFLSPLVCVPSLSFIPWLLYRSLSLAHILFLFFLLLFSVLSPVSCSLSLSLLCHVIPCCSSLSHVPVTSLISPHLHFCFTLSYVPFAPSSYTILFPHCLPMYLRSFFSFPSFVPPIFSLPFSLSSSFYSKFVLYLVLSSSLPSVSFIYRFPFTWRFIYTFREAVPMELLHIISSFSF